MYTVHFGEDYLNNPEIFENLTDNLEREEWDEEKEGYEYESPIIYNGWVHVLIRQVLTTGDIRKVAEKCPNIAILKQTKDNGGYFLGKICSGMDLSDELHAAYMIIDGRSPMNI